MPFKGIRDECCKRSVHKEESQNLSVPMISLLLRLRLQTVACGGVFAPQMTQMHAVYPPIWHATLHVLTPPSGRSRPSLLSKEEQQKAPGSVQDSRTPKHFCSIPNSKTFLLNDRFMEIAAAPLESAAQVAHINWEISRKKAVEEQETSWQHPVPPARVHSISHHRFQLR